MYARAALLLAAGLLFIVPGSYSLTRLYEDINHNASTLLTEQNEAGGGCQTIPAHSLKKVKSIKSDSCIVLYTGSACGSGNSLVVRDGTVPNLSKTAHEGIDFSDLLMSYERCPTLPTTLSVSFSGNGVTANFNNVCELRNVAKEVSAATVLNNNNNCVIIKTDGGTKTEWRLEGGRSLESQNLTIITAYKDEATKYNKILSISPCEALPGCNMLTATVTKFVVKDAGVVNDSSSMNVSMTAEKEFINDAAWAFATEQYSASNNVDEVALFTLVDSAANIATWAVAADSETEIEDSVPAEARVIAEAHLKTAYTRDAKAGEMTERHEKARSFDVSESIEVDPCYKYKVDAYVDMTTGKTLTHTVTFEVTGMSGTRPLTIAEIRAAGSIVGGVEKDEYTLELTQEANLVVDYGVKPFVVGVGEQIQGCVPTSSKVGTKFQSRDTRNAGGKVQGGVFSIVLAVTGIMYML